VLKVSLHNYSSGEVRLPMAATVCIVPAEELGLDLNGAVSSPHSPSDTFSSPPAPPLNIQPPSDNQLDIDEDTDYDLNQHVIHSPADDRRTSTYSTVSSLPASVLHHEPSERTPTRPHVALSARHGSASSFASDVTPSRRRGYAAAFRNPSSVRAMQMRDEIDDDSASFHRRNGSQHSIRSHSSSPSKRLSRSSQSSPMKTGSKLKKEFPLVLLHCTLLPPSNGLVTSLCDNELFGALLPEEYRKNWLRLQERLAMPEVQARGILIPHPQDEYDLLEERIFETLELEKPRIRSNHFVPNNGGDSGFESGSQTEDEAEIASIHELTCPDCGKGVGKHLNRKWEVKVYAANGLMRAGAWVAAWRDMEKVDIEISLCLPEDVRQEVSARLEALKASEQEVEHETQQAHDHADSRDKEVYGEEPQPPRSPGTEMRPDYGSFAHPRGNQHVHIHDSYAPIPLIDHLRDTKTIAIILLSMILMYLGVNANTAKVDAVSGTSTASSTGAVPTTTVTSTAVVSEASIDSVSWTSSVANHIPDTTMDVPLDTDTSTTDPDSTSQATANVQYELPILDAKGDSTQGDPGQS
jgi:hypothetical protein